MPLQAAWGLLLVLKIPEPWFWSNRFLHGSNFLSQILDGKVLHAFLDEFEASFPAAQFCFLAAFAIPPVRTLRYFSVAVQNCTYGPGDISLRFHFCAAAWIEMALCVIKAQAAEFAAMRWVHLVDKFIMAASFALDQSLVSSLRFSPSLGRFLANNLANRIFPPASMWQKLTFLWGASCLDLSECTIETRSILKYQFLATLSAFSTISSADETVWNFLFYTNSIDTTFGAGCLQISIKTFHGRLSKSQSVRYSTTQIVYLLTQCPDLLPGYTDTNTSAASDDDHLTPRFRGL